jgi:hypothetical protein
MYILHRPRHLCRCLDGDGEALYPRRLRQTSSRVDTTITDVLELFGGTQFGRLAPPDLRRPKLSLSQERTAALDFLQVSGSTIVREEALPCPT